MLLAELQDFRGLRIASPRFVKVLTEDGTAFGRSKGMACATALSAQLHQISALKAPKLRWKIQVYVDL